jgi:hypothetical protein
MDSGNSKEGSGAKIKNEGDICKIAKEFMPLKGLCGDTSLGG